MRLPGFIGILLGLLAAAGELAGVAFPTARWFFEASRDVPWLHSGSGDDAFPWFGWLCTVVLITAGSLIVIRSFSGTPPNPLTQRRIRRFREINRGYWSLVILCVLATLAALDQTVVGKRALAVKHEGRWSFPAFLPNELKNRDFGILGDLADAPADYRKLKRVLEADGSGRVILPPIPYDPTGDTLPPRSRPLERIDGLHCDSADGKPYWGLAGSYHDADHDRMRLRFTLRDGRLSGVADGWLADGTPCYTAEYRDGRLLTERYTGPGTKEAFLGDPLQSLRAIRYHPSPPSPADRHWLGTNSQGYDVLAYLYGGLQVNFKAALIYLPIVYLIGISIGMMMGYFGGWFDLAVQRLIEVFSNVPFLFVVIIISSKVPEKFKGLPVILTILVAFGWMGMTYLMRTAAYRDKERDYIAAARVLGARTPRILFRHLLPNTVAIIVTLVPFTMSGLVFALTSLDYLGFGLPPEYATWGRLLNDGLSNLSAPWLVSSTFTVLVGLLVLITFVGEAVREAFDPKKFTYYR
ncbi:MAG: ABC transporter permease subunit [Verrucomicrobia bacterium]|jgi:microcin C transport system permease protein|nr:ABC transporter permease subunit [Verrucomicrobiota bacterium]